jgi:hypothetical protein
MLYVDIPMYYGRITDQDYIFQSDKTFYNHIEGMASCNIVSKSYEIWKDEIPWMSGYFIGATWLSIELIYIYNLLVN